MPRKDPEQKLAYNRMYREQNKELIRQKALAHYYANREEINAKRNAKLRQQLQSCGKIKRLMSNTLRNAASRTTNGVRTIGNIHFNTIGSLGPRSAMTLIGLSLSAIDKERQSVEIGRF